jgi:ribosome maturation factor RimP
MQDIVQVIENEIVGLLSADPTLFLVQLKISAKNDIKVFIDGDQGVSIGVCTSISRKLFKYIEENSLFKENDFSLEVSSPGVDEPLLLNRQFIKNIERSVEVVMNDGAKIEGVLKNVLDNSIELEETKGKGKKMEVIMHVIKLDEVKTTTVQIKF